MQGEDKTAGDPGRSRDALSQMCASQEGVASPGKYKGGPNALYPEPRTSTAKTAVFEMQTFLSFLQDLSLGFLKMGWTCTGASEFVRAGATG